MEELVEDFAEKHGEITYKSRQEQKSKVRYQPKKTCFNSFHKFDIFGEMINFHVDKHHKKITSPLGGIMSLILIGIIVTQMYQTIFEYIHHETYEYDSSDYAKDFETHGEVKMIEFDPSFNVFFGV